ncbi:MAG TPA: MFS transporter [Bryobacteraceae bacterium]|nr:MFS transporter [Bryobacteraceae bacterium]
MTSPSRVRHSIVGLALLINLVSYVDRACISVAAPHMRAEFGFTPTQMGLVFSIFSLSYFVAQTPWGMAADRFGARRLVALAIFWWSGFTALTAAAWSFVSLLVIRFVFGAVEAALSPAIAAAFTRWIPQPERSTAFGAYLSGGRTGGALAPPLAAFLVLRYGWRFSFVAFAALGLGAMALWWFWYRDDPARHRHVNQGELDRIAAGRPTFLEDRAPVDWRRLLLSRPLLLILAVAFGYTFMWQFYITWFPTYLIERRGMPLSQASTYAGLPFVFGLAANWAGGILADQLSRRYGTNRGRGALGFSCLVLSAGLLFIGLRDPDAGSAALLIALAAGFGDMSLGAIWASAVEVGGKAAGAVAGLVNAASNLGGFVSPVLIGFVFDLWKDWDSVLLMAVAANVISAFLWLGVQHEERIPEAVHGSLR